MLATVLALLAFPHYTSLLLSAAELEDLKAAAGRRDLRVAALADRLRADAERRFAQGPWSVTFHRPKGIQIGVHDFFSEGPYWWPDPKNPGGPYIRRDGETNPDRFVENDRDLGEMGEAVLSLGAAAFLFDDERFAGRAAEAMRVWLVDEKTRMNPNLEYGQAIHGVTQGRGIGIIDTRPLIWVAQGAALLESTGRWKAAERDAVKQWLRDYLRWLTTSQKGLEEKKNGNNHSTWWAAQAAAYAAFAGDKATLEMVWQTHRNYLVPQEIRPDGSCPAEEARTKSLGYSSMNLDGFAMLCRLARHQGADLWSFRLENGAGVERAVEYLAPFVERPEAWKKQQISPYRNDRQYFLALAGMDLGKPKYAGLYKRLAWGRNNSPWFLLLDMVVALR